MATTPPKISLAELDFEEIKTNLKRYLQDQSEFVDFDFEGAGINILLDILALNSHYTAFFANMLANEMFLDSAILRGSVVSHAKTIGYTPYSKRAAKAIVDLTVEPTTDSHDPGAISIPRNCQFRITNNGTTYSFCTIDSITVKKNTAGDYVAEGAEIYEGILTTLTYEVDNSNDDQRFIINDRDVDISSLKVTVQTSINDATTNVYTLASKLTDIESDTKAFWIQENELGYFEVLFGDGVVGRKLDTGNLVTLEFLITNGKETNGLGTNESFTFSANPPSYNYNNVNYDTNNITIEVITPAAGGSDAEDIESIRFLAPRLYSAQNRAVTTQDYKALIMQAYPSIESVAVWGGEDAEPVALGKVYISLKPYAGTEIAETTKTEIAEEFLKQHNVVTIEPVMVDPDYTYLVVDSDIKFDTTITTKSSSDIETLVFNAIKNYGDVELEKFSKGFRFSKFTTMIDDVDVAILNNNTTIRIKKIIEPTLNTAEDHTLYFNNALTANTVSSTGFTLNEKLCYFDDDGAGKIRIYYIDSITEEEVYVNNNAGAIDYVAGTITIDDLNVSATVESEDEIHVSVTPTKEDITTLRNQILIISDDDITVAAEEETPEIG